MVKKHARDIVKSYLPYLSHFHVTNRIPFMPCTLALPLLDKVVTCFMLGRKKKKTDNADRSLPIFLLNAINGILENKLKSIVKSNI